MWLRGRSPTQKRETLSNARDCPIKHRPIKHPQDALRLHAHFCRGATLGAATIARPSVAWAARIVRTRQRGFVEHCHPAHAADDDPGDRAVDDAVCAAAGGIPFPSPGARYADHAQLIQTLIGLALVLTFFLMQPVGAAIYAEAIVPLDAGHITAMAALDRAIIPMRHFMLKYAREKDLALFVELAREPRPARADDLGMRIVAPAYLLSELQAGFRIGAALFLPFLVIDLVTAAITTSVGMMQLPPVIIRPRSRFCCSSSSMDGIC